MLKNSVGRFIVSAELWKNKKSAFLFEHLV